MSTRRSQHEIIRVGFRVSVSFLVCREPLSDVPFLRFLFYIRSTASRLSENKSRTQPSLITYNNVQRKKHTTHVPWRANRNATRHHASTGDLKSQHSIFHSATHTSTSCLQHAVAEASSTRPSAEAASTSRGICSH